METEESMYGQVGSEFRALSWHACDCFSGLISPHFHMRKMDQVIYKYAKRGHDGAQRGCDVYTSLFASMHTSSMLCKCTPEEGRKEKKEKKKHCKEDIRRTI